MLTRTIFTLLTTLWMLLKPFSAVSTNIIETVDPVLYQHIPEDYTVDFYPVAPYHIGDLLSARVTYHGSKAIDGREITLALADDPETILETAAFSRFSRQAVFYWFSDTSEFDPGFLSFIFSVPETGDQWLSGIPLLPTPDNRSATWETVRSACCTLHYFSETDAARDIDEILEILTFETEQAFSQFFPNGIPQENPLVAPLEVVLIPTVVGHGGFATDVAVLTYSDRNWAGIKLETLGHHEIVHVLDRHFNQGPRPSLFSEGIAVYLSGGHYRPGDPLQRAAALRELGLYLPIADITDDFYAAQHEIGYMEAAALVAYLAETWGWETFLDFYFNLPEEDSDSQEIISGLETQFGMDLADLEAEFIAYLETLTPDDNVLADVEMTVEVYDMIRRYQTIAIPSAHFRTAWWPPVDRMRQEGIVGDYAHREKSPFNVIIETLFLEIHAGLESGDYALVSENLARISHYLDAVEYLRVPASHYSIGWPLPEILDRPIRP